MSGVAHAGDSDVPTEEVESIRQLCLRTLFALTVSPAFAAMTKSVELDEWFTDRLLDSPSHLSNSDTQPGIPVQDAEQTSSDNSARSHPTETPPSQAQPIRSSQVPKNWSPLLHPIVLILTVFTIITGLSSLTTAILSYRESRRNNL
jgi:hypothetical protein